jgi:hypothetical protein
MRMLLLAAAVAVTGPLTAYAAPRTVQLSQSSAPVFHQPDASQGVTVLSVRPADTGAGNSEFIGPYSVHDGLLPNGLTPNPPTYG